MAHNFNLGKYPQPHSVCVGQHGWFLFLSYNVKSSDSTLYKARLHSPVDNITEIKKGLNAKAVKYTDDLIFVLLKSGDIMVLEDRSGSLNFKPSTKLDKATLQKMANNLNLNLPSHAVKETIVAEIAKHLKTVKTSYSSRQFNTEVVNDWKEPTVCFLCFILKITVLQM